MSTYRAVNQEKALVGAFSVIVKTDCETDGWSTTQHYSGAMETAELDTEIQILVT